MSLSKKDQEQAYLRRITINLVQAEEDFKEAEEALEHAKKVRNRAIKELKEYTELVSNEQE